MKAIIPTSKWSPADGLVLEPNAMEVVKSESNYLVVAGPGAGKTELLAQRAAFLLQTNQCPSPRRILAISFKRDAAYNLRLRVQKRVGIDLAGRFTSQTFDSFAKGLVDRFRMGIPDDYRPKPGFDILTDTFPIEAKEAFGKALVMLGKETTTSRINWKGYGNQMYRLTEDEYPLPSPKSELAILTLNELLNWKGTSKITFPILSRLAAYLLSSNPKILSYLRQTYSHVFLDEFQDTTRLQFSLLLAAFEDSGCVLTAVGDTKQRIMLWAGAMEGIFEEYDNHFDVTGVPLKMNFRSAPRLITLQNHLSGALLGNKVDAIPRPDLSPDEGTAEFWVFDNAAQEAGMLAQKVDEMIEENGISPREICFLFKQQAEHYAQPLIEELAKLNISARIENELQDLLLEPVIAFIRNMIRSALDKKDGESHEALLVEYARLEGIDDENDLLDREVRIRRRLQEMNGKLRGAVEWGDVFKCLLKEVKLIGYKRFRLIYEQYNRKFFNDRILLYLGKLEECFNSKGTFVEAFNLLEGEDSIPIMTVHKSKGLEFEAVFFIGFDDQNFWSFKKQPDEDTCAFFVALSRAKNAVYFTYSILRENPWSVLEKRSIKDIRGLYDKLADSEIMTFKDFRTKEKPTTPS